MDVVHVPVRCHVTDYINVPIRDGRRLRACPLGRGGPRLYLPVPCNVDGCRPCACPLGHDGQRLSACPLGRRRLPTTLADEVFCDMATVDVTGHLPPDTCTPKNYYRGRLPLAEVTV